jgi:integrase
MATVKKLSAREVASAGVGKHGDGGGLWLVVRKNGSRAWVFRYSRLERERTMGLGPLDRVSLADARELARDARRLLAKGKDPINERRARKSQTPIFGEAAAAFIAAHEAAWRNPKHRQQWRNTINTYAAPAIGDLPVDEVGTTDVLRVLEPIWRTKVETASRLRGRIEKVLDWAAAQGFRSRENPARWRGHLDALLPAPSKVKRVRHHAAMDWREVPAFVVKLRAQIGIAARALEFAIMTAARSGEVRGATWAEIDLAASTWTVPADRMKTEREHRVPLSDEAMRLLRDLPRFEGSEYVFPSPRTGRSLSDSALTKVLRDLGLDVTAHGFRSSFRDWCAETTRYPREVAEAALAHTLSNKTEAAYLRGDFFDKRRRLMTAWSAYCDSPPPAGEVVAIGEAR